MISLTQECTMPDEQLTSTQQAALNALIVGKTISESAEEAGVHRNTVHRWIKSDEPFQAARHRMQRDVQASVNAKLHDTAMAAVDCIEKCLLEGDVYVAEQLLKGLGCFDGKLKDLGTEDAVELALEALHHSALSDMFRRHRRHTVGQAVSDEAEKETLAGRDDDSRQAQPDLHEVQHDATSEDVFAVEHEGETCEIDAYGDLTTQQTTAMFAMLTGQTLDEAAHTADTDAATVYGWLRGDCTFQANMNRCAGERRQSIQTRLDHLATRAADLVDRKVCQGNGRMAIQVLKGLGYLNGRPTSLGSEDPQNEVEPQERLKEYLV